MPVQVSSENFIFDPITNNNSTMNSAFNSMIYWRTNLFLFSFLYFLHFNINFGQSLPQVQLRVNRRIYSSNDGFCVVRNRRISFVWWWSTAAAVIYSAKSSTSAASTSTRPLLSIGPANWPRLFATFIRYHSIAIEEKWSDRPVCASQFTKPISFIQREPVSFQLFDQPSIHPTNMICRFMSKRDHCITSHHFLVQPYRT